MKPFACRTAPSDLLLCSLHQRESHSCRADGAAAGEGPEGACDGPTETGRNAEPREESHALWTDQEEEGAHL